MQGRMPLNMQEPASGIEQDHVELFHEIHYFQESLQAGHGVSTVGRAIHWLFTKLPGHFQAEEEIMRAGGYPLADSHRNSHQEILQVLESVVKTFEKEGATRGVCQKTASLIDLVHRHTHNEDQAMDQFFTKKSRKGN